MTSAGDPPKAERATQRPDGLARAVALEERLAEAAEQLRRGDALLGVLDADAEDLLGLLDLAEVDARAAEQPEALGDERRARPA